MEGPFVHGDRKFGTGNPGIKTNCVAAPVLRALPDFECIQKEACKPCFKIIYKEEVPRFIGQHFHFDFEDAPRDETMDLMVEIMIHNSFMKNQKQHSRIQLQK